MRKIVCSENKNECCEYTKQILVLLTRAIEVRLKCGGNALGGPVCRHVVQEKVARDHAPHTVQKTNIMTTTKNMARDAEEEHLWAARTAGRPSEDVTARSMRD